MNISTTLRNPLPYQTTGTVQSGPVHEPQTNNAIEESPQAPTTESNDSWTMAEARDAKLLVLNYNIDTNATKAEEGPAAESHPEWRANERIKTCVIPTIDKLIESKRPGLIHIQEGRLFKTRKKEIVDSVNPLKSAFEGHGYCVVTANYTETGGDESHKPFTYITAYDPSVLQFKRGYVKYMTQTPDHPTDRSGTQDDIKKNNFGMLWERGVFIAEFTHKDFKESIYSINVHTEPLLPNENRFETSRVLEKCILDILVNDPDAKIVMSGDFNIFPEPECMTDAQLAVLKNATYHDKPLLTEASEHLQYPNKTEATRTFVGFPYDFFGVPIKGTKINDIELKDLIEKLPPVEKAHAQQVFSNMPSPFVLRDFLSSLTDIGCRKQMIGLIYEQCRAVGGKLDRSYYRGFDRAKCKLQPAPQFSDAPIDIEDDKAVKDYVLAHHDDGPAYASDHQPMMTSLFAAKSK